MFFQQFNETSPTQELLQARNLATETGATVTTLTDDDKKLIADPELQRMLSTQEPPAVRFVNQRLQPIVELATTVQLLPHATEPTKNAEDLAVAALELLTGGEASLPQAIARSEAIFVGQLCNPLLAVCTAPNAAALVAAARSAGMSDHSPLNRPAAAVHEPDVVQTPATLRTIVLPMHVCKVLSSAIAVAAPRPMMSESLARMMGGSGSLLGSGSSSGGRSLSMTRQHTESPMVLTTAAGVLGAAACAALGLVKDAHELVTSTLAAPAHVSLQLYDAFLSDVVHRVPANHQERVTRCRRAAAFMRALEDHSTILAPSTNPGHDFVREMHRLLTESAFYALVAAELFSDFSADSPATSGQRAAAMSALNHILLRSHWYTECWTGPEFKQCCLAFVDVQRTPAFLAALSKASPDCRREDQLRCVDVMLFTARLARRLVGGDTDEPHAPLSTFDDVRMLLPPAEAFGRLHDAVLASPNCSVLHSAVGDLLHAVMRVNRSAIGSLTMRPASPASPILTTASTALQTGMVGAVVGSIIVDEAAVHQLAVDAAAAGIDGFAALMCGVAYEQMDTYADPSEVSAKAFTSVCNGSLKSLASSGVKRDGDEPLPTGGALFLEFGRCGVSAKVTRSSTEPQQGPIKVDEVDDPKLPSPSCSSEQAPVLPPAALAPPAAAELTVTAPSPRGMPQVAPTTSSFQVRSASLDTSSGTDPFSNSDVKTSTSKGRFGTIRRRNQSSSTCSSMASPKQGERGALVPPAVFSDGGATTDTDTDARAQLGTVLSNTQSLNTSQSTSHGRGSFDHATNHHDDDASPTRYILGTDASSGGGGRPPPTSSPQETQLIAALSYGASYDADESRGTFGGGQTLSQSHRSAGSNQSPQNAQLGADSASLQPATQQQSSGGVDLFSSWSQSAPTVTSASSGYQAEPSF